MHRSITVVLLWSFKQKNITGENDWLFVNNEATAFFMVLLKESFLICLECSLWKKAIAKWTFYSQWHFCMFMRKSRRSIQVWEWKIDQGQPRELKWNGEDILDLRIWCGIDNLTSVLFSLYVCEMDPNIFGWLHLYNFFLKETKARSALSLQPFIFWRSVKWAWNNAKLIWCLLQL